jgi:high-affinity Fe2+/Pb2+ permease
MDILGVVLGVVLGMMLCVLWGFIEAAWKDMRKWRKGEEDGKFIWSPEIQGQIDKTRRMGERLVKKARRMK